jgi:transcriptional regulator with XRE-family HTH domain
MTLREARFRRGLTQYDVSRLTGISAPRISLVERGYAKFRLREREAIAKALSMSVEEIDFDELPLPKRLGSIVEHSDDLPPPDGEATSKPPR